MRLSSSTAKKISAAIIVSLLGLVIFFQKKHDDLGPPFTTRLAQAKRTLLPATILPYITFGFDNIIADMYWIRSIQDFVAWNGREGFFIGYFKNITTLDPTFEYPYLFSILTIPQNKNIAVLNEVASISEKGIQALPESWQIPFYLGTQYYIFTKQYDPAEKYLKIAAEKKSAPDGVYLLYSTFVGRALLTTAQKQGLAQKLIKTIYNNTDNEIIKKLAEKGIQEELISQVLEKGIIAYKERYKRYPKNVDEMLAVNFIRLPQEFLDYFTVTISERDGMFSIKERN